MKKIFVATDNKIIFSEIKFFLDCQKNIKVNYFCSPNSISYFKKEIDSCQINPLIIKENIDFLINNYEIGISCHSKQLFPPKLVNSILCINVHPGFNPYNRGWYPHVFSMINGMPIGVTIHIMDEEIDHGDIIIQEEVKIYSWENSLDVYNKLLIKEIELFKKVFNNIVEKKFKKIKPFSEGNYNSINDYKKLCEIDLNKIVTMREAINYFRAMTHPPYKNCYFIDEDGNKVFVSIILEKGEK